MNNGRIECTFLWLIENYSYCWHRNGEGLFSPEFTADVLEGTVWKLQLNPRGSRQEVEDYISLYLRRCDDAGPEDFSVKYEMSILAADGLSTPINTEYTFKRGSLGYGWPKFAKMDEVLKQSKDDYLPQDTLSVRCRLWRGEGSVQEVSEIKARTRIGIEEISFLHFTESFSTLQPDEKKTTQIKSRSKKGCNLTSGLYYIDASEGKIMLEITPSAKNQILTKCNIFLRDRSGKKIECGEFDNRLDATRKDIQNLPLSLTRQAILNAKSDYLPEDNLSLSCECVFSTGVEYEKIERTVYAKPFVASNQIANAVQNESIYNAPQKLSACPKAMDDLSSIYNSQLLTDVEIKTKTKSFPAHKIWLCARSPVFKTMLTSDMRERNSNVIPIDDLEDDTVQQLLLFLYTDRLENLCWESAVKLYFAGDKYQIERLKVTCASFLVDNVSAASASELLILADTHSDSDLKKAVKDFILKHEEEVFGSEEWGKLTEVNCQLACKTMLLKYK